MRRRVWAALGGLVTLFVVAMPAAAIIDGEPDGNAHPYVGLVAFFDGQGDYLHRCSGTLISSTLFLTAGHCTYGTASAKVWFDAELSAHPETNPPGGVAGTPHSHPSFDDFATYPESGDVGVVVLSKHVRMSAYGELPSQGELDALARRRGQKDVTFTTVGYGLQDVEPENQADLVRYRATIQLINLESALTDGYNLQHTGAPGTGGATCFGDSGGPIFKGTSKVVVAVTSWGPNPTCLGPGFGYRLDIGSSLDFVREFL